MSSYFNFNGIFTEFSFKTKLTLTHSLSVGLRICSPKCTGSLMLAANRLAIFFQYWTLICKKLAINYWKIYKTLGNVKEEAIKMSVKYTNCKSMQFFLQKLSFGLNSDTQKDKVIITGEAARPKKSRCFVAIFYNIEKRVILCVLLP